jgi:conjugal transfer pilus assembly protein TraI
MSGMFAFLRRLTTRASPAPAAQPAPGAPAVPAPVRPEIPRYPPFLQGLPVVPSVDLLATQDELIGRLRHGIGCTPEFFAIHVLPVVDRYAAFVHLLPASEAHHHRGAGGLLHHGLEVAFLAGQASHGKVFAYDREPKVRRVHEPLWRLAAALAGLCHDIGKPVSDLSVTDREGTRTWSPMQETIAAWAAGHGIDSYFLHWRDRRHNRHESAGMMALERVLGPATIAMLYQADPEIMNALIDAVAGQNEGATLSQLVTDADRASVESDLKTNRIDPQATALGVPIERYLLDAMARLVRTGAWRINIPGARLWMLQEGLHVVWPQGGDEIVGLLAADRVPGIPRHPDTLADLLLERGYATAPDDGDGVRRYWRLAPALLAREGKPVVLSLLRLASPSLVLSGPAPAAVDLHSESPVRVAVPGFGHVEIQGHPGLRPRAVSQPFLLDETPQDDPNTAGLDPARSEHDGELVAAIQVARIPSTTDKETPAAQSGQRRNQHGDDGAGSAPMSAASRAVQAVAAPQDDPRTLALAWFQSRRPGAGARLLLALAEAIRTGAREPESVLYVAGSQVWVRVPAGLDGFGAAVEVQIDALWDDDLLAVDILKPYLRVREIDGIRGVALKAEPSGHFLALVPAAALEHCTQEASMAISPAAAASTAAPATVDQPKPPARRRRPTSNTAAASPRPSPTTTSPSAKPSPSAVADALLAQVREEHARTTAGPDGERTVIVLTRADIAAAAQAAGLQPQSIRRALMGRPGCTVTADAGVEIAIP